VLPIDVAMAETSATPVHLAERFYASPAPAGIIERTSEILAEAQRPLIVIGGGARKHAAAIRELVDLLDVPFVTTPRGKGIVSEHHPRSLRNGGMAASAWARAYTSLGVDAALVLGTDLDDTSVGTTPYIAPGGTLVHVDRDSSVFHRNHPATLAVRADLGEFTEALTHYATKEGMRNGRCRDLLKEIKAEAPTASLRASEHAVASHHAVLGLEAAFPGAMFVSDIGEHMLFAMHFLTATGPDDFAIQLNLGSMGSGVAGAIGHAIGSPGRRIVCIVGDGCMQMAGMELLVAVRERLPIVFAVFNDGRYNMVHHGMRQIFGDASEWAAPPVDFAAWARAIGVPSMRVDTVEDLERERIASADPGQGPMLLDIRIDPSIRLPGAGRVEALSRMSMREVKR
jgi:acetolactate synthase-1/2/3 large subunit